MLSLPLPGKGAPRSAHKQLGREPVAGEVRRVAGAEGQPQGLAQARRLCRAAGDAGSGWRTEPGEAAALLGSLQEPLQQQQGEVVNSPGIVTAQERESTRQKPSLPSWLLEELGTPAAGRLPVPNDSGTRRPAADRAPVDTESASVSLEPGAMSALPAWLSREADSGAGASPPEQDEREPGQATAGSMPNRLQMRPDSDSSQHGSHSSSHEPVVVANGDGPPRPEKPPAGQLSLVLFCT